MNIAVLELCGRGYGEVKDEKRDNSKRLSHLTAPNHGRTIVGVRSRALPVKRSLHGGDTASTGVETRGMHAEPHRLVNPVENKVTANTQLALAA
jgi:hypothetical protein